MYLAPFLAAFFGAEATALIGWILYRRIRIKTIEGDGNDPDLAGLLRRLDRFAKYAPFSLLLFYIAAEQGVNNDILFVTCVLLLLGVGGTVAGDSSDRRMFFIGHSALALGLAGLSIAIFVGWM
jgi:uncharacterized membrane protein YecN with MAPEG domain